MQHKRTSIDWIVLSLQNAKLHVFSVCEVFVNRHKNTMQRNTKIGFTSNLVLPYMYMYITMRINVKVTRLHVQLYSKGMEMACNWRLCQCAPVHVDLESEHNIERQLNVLLTLPASLIPKPQSSWLSCQCSQRFVKNVLTSVQVSSCLHWSNCLWQISLQLKEEKGREREREGTQLVKAACTLYVYMLSAMEGTWPLPHLLAVEVPVLYKPIIGKKRNKNIMHVCHESNSHL